MAHFTIPGEPCGKGRPRVVRQGSFTRTYTPEKTVNYENLVKLEYQHQCGETHIPEGNVKMILTAYYAVPASASKRKRDAMLCGTIRPTKKPDCDNVIKIVCDALNGLAYKDDAQIVSVQLEKLYAAIPKVIVEIEEVYGSAGVSDTGP